MNKLINCRTCNKEFIRHINNQIYCSVECRKIGSYEKDKERHRIYRENNRDLLRKRGLEFYYKNKEKLNKYSKEYSINLKLKVIEHYSNSTMQCTCCGENHIEFLTIDHIDCGKIIHDKNKRPNRYCGIQLYLYLVRNKFPIGYQVLCFNCNCAKGIYGECPHNEKPLNTIEE